MSIKFPSKKIIAATFSKRALQYYDKAFIQHKINSLMLEILKQYDNKNLQWLDAGCGIGFLGGKIKEKKIGIKLFQTDIAFNSLKHIKTNKNLCTQADLENIPYKDSVFNGIVCSSVFQWIPDINKALKEIYRIMKNNGVLIFSVFIDGSFSQIFYVRKLFNLPYNIFLPKLDEFNAILKECGFSNIKVKSFCEDYYFKNAFELLKYFSSIGSTAVYGKRLNRKELNEFCNTYEKHFSLSLGIPLTIKFAIGKADKIE
jgi:malonyl-ACP O-methyltransferase BioC